MSLFMSLCPHGDSSRIDRVPALRAVAAVASLFISVTGCGGGNLAEEPIVATDSAPERSRALASTSAAGIGADPSAVGAVGNFSVDHSTSGLESSVTPISLGYLNDHKAGAKGQIRSVGRNLFVGSEQIRLYGINMAAGATTPTKADAIKIAARLRKEGFNAVRMVSFDRESPKTNTLVVTHEEQGILNPDQTLNSSAIDAFDHFVYQLQQQGIYVMLTLHASRIYPEAPDCLHHCNGIDNYIPALIQSQKTYSATLLNHVNPYTGRAYRSDPGIFAIEINNENSLSQRWAAGTIDSYLTDPVLYPKYGLPLEILWRQWLTRKYLAVAALNLSWGQSFTSIESIKAPLKANKSTLSAKYYSDWVQFAGEIEVGYNNNMLAHLKSTLGVTSLVLTTQSNYTPAFARTGDLVDIHTYVGDNTTDLGLTNPTNGRPVFRVQNKSLLASEPYAGATITGMWGGNELKDLNKPNIITEYAYRYGNQHLAEAEPLLSYSAGFQEMAAVFMFNQHNMNHYGMTDYYTGWYNNTVPAITRVISALAFRRGDVSPGEPQIVKTTKQTYLDKAGQYKSSSLSNFHLGGNARAVATRNMYQQIVDTKDQEQIISAGNSTNGVYTSTTSEMNWTIGDRVVIKTPMTKSAIGYFNNSAVDLGSGIQVNIGYTMNRYASIQLTSMINGSALPSGRMLLALAGHWTVPGEYPRLPGATDFSWGTALPRAEAVPATVRIATAKNLVVTALDSTGARKANVPVVRVGSTVEFVTGSVYDTGWYLIEDAASVPANLAPNATVTAPATAVAGAAVAISAGATDSDGSITKVEFFDGTTLISTDTTAPYAASWTPTLGGVHSITSRATDNGGLSTISAPVVVTVSGGTTNKAPTVSLTAPASATIGTAVTLGATATDADGTVGKVEFFDGATLIGTDASSPYSLTWMPTTVGAHSITARATDNAGATATSSVTSVNAVATTNKAPTVSLAAAATATMGTAVTVTASAADSDGSVAKVEFFDGTAIVGTDTTSPFSLTWTPATAGIHSLTARATDNGGSATTSAAVTVTVAPVPNKSPTAALSAPATGTVGTAMTLASTATDSDGTVTQVQFFDGTTLVGADNTSPFSIAWTPMTAGNHGLTVRATDNMGAATTSQVVPVNISAPVNKVPTANLVAPTVATVGKAVALSATAVDTDGTVTSVAFFEGTTLLATDTASPFSVNWTPTTPGNLSLTVRATDNSGAVTTSQAVVVNVTAPVNKAPSVSLTAPSPVALGETIILNASAGDTDGQVAKVDFFDGAKLIGTDTSSPYNLTWKPGTVGTHALTVRATDNAGAVTTSAAFNLVVDWPATGGLLANYFPNVSLSGVPAITRMEAVNLVYKAPATPGLGIPADNWSARWTGSVVLPAAGTYSFQVTIDDGARISVNGQVVASKWAGSGNVSYSSVAIAGSAGQRIPISIEHYDGKGDSTVRLRWKSSGSYWIDIPAGQLSPD